MHKKGLDQSGNRRAGAEPKRAGEAGDDGPWATGDGTREQEAERWAEARGARRDWFKNSNGEEGRLTVTGNMGLDAGGDPEAPHSRTAL